MDLRYFQNCFRLKKVRAFHWNNQKNQNFENFKILGQKRGCFGDFGPQGRKIQIFDFANGFLASILPLVHKKISVYRMSRGVNFNLKKPKILIFGQKSLFLA